MEFYETWEEARSKRLLPSLCYWGWSEKQDGRPGLWFAETFSTSLKSLNGIQRNLTGSKLWTSSTKFVFFGPIWKTRWPPQPLIGWDIFDFFSETTERNSTKLDRKQDLNVFYQVCVFWADRKKTDGSPSLWLAETFSTFPLKPLNRIRRNLTGSKISTSFTKSVSFGPIGTKRWRPWPMIGWDIFIRPSSDGTYYGMVMSVRPGLRPSVHPSVRPSVTVFRNFLLHALTYWSEILCITLFLCT